MEGSSSSLLSGGNNIQSGSQLINTISLIWAMACGVLNKHH